MKTIRINPCFCKCILLDWNIPGELDRYPGCWCCGTLLCQAISSHDIICVGQVCVSFELRFQPQAHSQYKEIIQNMKWLNILSWVVRYEIHHVDVKFPIVTNVHRVHACAVPNLVPCGLSSYICLTVKGGVLQRRLVVVFCIRIIYLDISLRYALCIQVFKWQIIIVSMLFAFLHCFHGRIYCS